MGFLTATANQIFDAAQFLARRDFTAPGARLGWEHWFAIQSGLMIDGNIFHSIEKQVNGQMYEMQLDFYPSTGIWNILDGSTGGSGTERPFLTQKVAQYDINPTTYWFGLWHNLKFTVDIDKGQFLDFYLNGRYVNLRTFGTGLWVQNHTTTNNPGPIDDGTLRFEYHIFNGAAGAARMWFIDDAIYSDYEAA